MSKYELKRVSIDIEIYILVGDETRDKGIGNAVLEALDQIDSSEYSYYDADANLKNIDKAWLDQIPWGDRSEDDLTIAELIMRGLIGGDDDD